MDRQELQREVRREIERRGLGVQIDLVDSENVKWVGSPSSQARPRVINLENDGPIGQADGLITDPADTFISYGRIAD